jgi:site-specific recombinase XerD
MPKLSKNPSPDSALPKSNRGRRFPVEVLSAAEIGQLIDECSRTAPTGLRNRALIVVLWRAGLRLSEALALLPKDVDRVAGTLHVLNGKGGEDRIVALDPLAFSVLSRWLDERAQLKSSARSPVFCTLHGGPLQTAYVRALLPRLADAAGIGKRVHAHALRHTHACELLRERVPLNLIQKQLGHANLAVTSRYLDHVPSPELTDAMRRRVMPDEVAQALQAAD